MIDGQTAVYGLLGSSVSTSLSPAMHNAAFHELGLNAVYVALSVEPGRFEEAFRGAVSLGFPGLNVTIPFKEEAFRLVDEVDESAALAGAVNTIVISKNRTRGYNTDGTGFIDALNGMGFDPSGRRVLLLGAGGAARAVAMALTGRGIRALTIMNRCTERASCLAEWVGSRFTGIAPTILSFEASDEQLADAVAGSDLLIQATPCVTLPRAAMWLESKHTVVDLVSHSTPLVERADELGCLARDGREMLLYQGARAFSIWTGRPAPLQSMRQVVGSGWNIFD